ncbi:Transposase [Piscirickettsia salmonis]|uniref:Transposase n=1 Tax=Piscirickettsia salmonis TaxID=1238 RepID=A0A1L6TCS2_PISSA|nr:transposase [Piscirickettsia salmonis]ALT18509.1 transposase [Piscirickettsia salmonis LF-89 = ATCC VR-1361]ALY03113.1 transposase [Piscirickettsia salmonis]AMA42671.1 transposase [Piscirickettsia salmonis]AOS35143.1 transposase [Piscirickettsia salmonis]
MKQKKQSKNYPKEFKEEAVALVTEQGYSVQKAADSLGIRANLLYRWKDQQEKQAKSTMSPDEKEELKALRKEVKQLRMEKEILKKASAFFAKEMK